MCVLAVGKLVGAALDAVDLLVAEGVEPTLFDVRVVSPPDPAMLEAASAHQVVVTVEDGFRHGGAGEFLVVAIAEACHAAGTPLPSFRVLGVPRAFVAQGKPDQLLAELGLDGAGHRRVGPTRARRRARGRAVDPPRTAPGGSAAAAVATQPSRWFAPFAATNASTSR